MLSAVNETYYDGYNHTYDYPGHFLVNVTAWNRHSEVVYGHNKYTNNVTQMIHVEKAVTDDWTPYAPIYWIRDVGRKHT